MNSGFPVGGAHGVTRYMLRFGSRGRDLRLVGLCDTVEEEVYRKALIRTDVGDPQAREDMRKLGFHVCIYDLEEELIRSAGIGTVKDVFAAQGDLSSFGTLQRQSAWRRLTVEAQMRRFLGSGARRKLRYAALLIESIDMVQVPLPLNEVIRDATSLSNSNRLYLSLILLFCMNSHAV